MDEESHQAGRCGSKSKSAIHRGGRQATRAQKGAMVAGDRHYAPPGDCRLTANIRQELHRKLKIEAAARGTTIGDLLESLVEKHLCTTAA